MPVAAQTKSARRNVVFYQHPIAWMGVVMAIFVAVFMRWQMLPVDDPLRGNAEDSSMALAASLESLPEARQVEQLKQYVNDPSPGLRLNAIDTLTERNDAALSDILEHAYTDSFSVIRQRALDSLSDTNPTAGLKLLLIGLHDEDTWMREASILQLKSRSMGRKPLVDKRVVPALIAALDDPDTVLPFTGVDVLSRLTGHNWRYKNSAPNAEKQRIIAQWKAWWQTAQKDWPISPELTGLNGIHPIRQDVAPDFHITDLNGQNISLNGQKNRITLLNFWGTWCPPCQIEVPDLVRLDRDLRDKGVDVIGVALSENSEDSLRTWCKNHHVEYRQVMAPTRILKDYGGIHEVPISVLIDGNGQIRRRWEGERDYDTFRAAIENIQADKKL